MKAEIVLMTPEMAAQILRKNTHNRELKKSTMHAYVHQMRSKLWLENGEPIIIAANGILMNGQHRLNACITAKFSWEVPLITEVEESSMVTLDTGTNRTMGDLLKLNGFKDVNNMAGLVKSIIGYGRNLAVGDNSSKSVKISNNMGLQYAQKNHEGLDKVLNDANKLYRRQAVRILSVKDIALLLYATAGRSYDIKMDNITFIKDIIGVNSREGTACNHYFRTMVEFKERLHINPAYMWRLCAALDCWNIFAAGNAPISQRAFKVNIGSKAYTQIPAVRKLELDAV